MDVHLFRLTSPSPRATRIFKGSNQLVLLGVHRNHRVAPPPESLRQPVDIAKLAIAIPMLGSLFALDIELQPIVELFQQPGYGIGLNRMSPTSQCRGERACGLAGPTQQVPRIAGGAVLHQAGQFPAELGIDLFGFLASASGLAGAPSRLQT